MLAGKSKFVVRRDAGDHPSTHDLADLDGSKPNTAGCPEHRQRFTFLQRCAIFEGMKRGAVSDADAGGAIEIERVRNFYKFVGTQHDTLTRRAGKNLELILGDGSVFPRSGHSLLVNREVDSRTGTIQVRAQFPNPGNVLRPGQYARIRAVTEERKNALLVPQRAIAELQGIYQVGVVGSDNKVAIRLVKPGPQFKDMWVIDSGLQPGDQVVVDGLQRLRDGMTVTPTAFKDTQADAAKGGV